MSGNVTSTILSAVKTKKSKPIKDPKPSDLFMSSLKQTWKFVKERTRDRCKALGWLVNRGDMPIELGDSWYSAKTIEVVRL